MLITFKLTLSLDLFGMLLLKCIEKGHVLAKKVDEGYSP